ncbi:MAG: hypothetical protein ACXWPM_00875 [Bdellovibrionota bacterium]
MISHASRTDLIHELEKLKCRVRRHGERLLVTVPGIEAWLLPRSAMDVPGAALLWDQAEIDFDATKGRFRVRMSYGTLPQLILHAALNAILLGDYFLGSGASIDPSRFGLMIVALNLVPVAFYSLSRLQIELAVHRIMNDASSVSRSTTPGETKDA